MPVNRLADLGYVEVSRGRRSVVTPTDQWPDEPMPDQAPVTRAAPPSGPASGVMPSTNPGDLRNMAHNVVKTLRGLDRPHDDTVIELDIAPFGTTTPALTYIVGTLASVRSPEMVAG